MNVKKLTDTRLQGKIDFIKEQMQDLASINILYLEDEERAKHAVTTRKARAIYQELAAEKLRRISETVCEMGSQTPTG